MKRRRADAGFTLAGLICVLTAAAILAAAMVPAYVTQARREQEMELIFRGEEYIRAIQKYQRKYGGGVYPASIDDLLSRDGFRFLRRQYKDPITGEDFRFITVNPDMTLNGANTAAALPVSTQMVGVPGAIPGTGGPTGGPSGERRGNDGGGRTNTNNRQVQANSSSLGNVGGAGNSMGGFLGGGGSMGGGGSPLGGAANQGTSVGRVGAGGGVGTGGGTGVGTGVGAGGSFLGVGLGGLGAAVGMGGNPVAGMGNPNSTGAQSATDRAGTNGNGTGAGGTGIGAGLTPAPAGAPSAISGGGLGGGAGATVQISPGIAGVASESATTGIMVYNTKEKYNEWEFIAPLLQQQGPNNQPQPPK